MVHSATQSIKDLSSLLSTFEDKMRSERLPEACITTFRHYYQMVYNKETGSIPERSITAVPPESIAKLDSLRHYSTSGIPLLSRTALIKLNGGLGTTMGCMGPKSLIPVKNELTFLDIIIKNLIVCNKKYATTTPLILMNSFNTETESLNLIKQYPEIHTAIPASFIQHKFPRISEKTLEPVSFPNAPDAEWNPPGHGDLYLALKTSGTLRHLLENNFKYAFISNSDNVNAHLDPSIPGYMDAMKLDFLMEVAQRTPSDQKGGHLALDLNGSFVLREIKQCPHDDLHFFEDVHRHQFFNTNNLWINLESLDELLNKNGGSINLPLICNQKVLSASDKNTISVYQLESAMGSVISYFPATAIINVPRTRFLPVKNINDLVLMQSDAYSLTEEYALQLHTLTNDAPPSIKLDPVFFGNVTQLAERFPGGTPSLRNCSSLIVKGDIHFGTNITINGITSITNNSSHPVTIPDASTLTGTIIY